MKNFEPGQKVVFSFKRVGLTEFEANLFREQGYVVPEEGSILTIRSKGLYHDWFVEEVVFNKRGGRQAFKEFCLFPIEEQNFGAEVCEKIEKFFSEPLTVK